MENKKLFKNYLVSLNEEQRKFLKKYLQDREVRYGETYTYTFDPEHLIENDNVKELTGITLYDINNQLEEQEGHVLFRGTSSDLLSVYRGENEDDSEYDCFPTGSINKDDTLTLATLINLGDKYLGEASWKIKDKDNGVFGKTPVHTKSSAKLYMSHYDDFGSHNSVNPVINVYYTNTGTTYIYKDGAVFETLND